MNDPLDHVLASEVNDEALVLYGATKPELQYLVWGVGSVMLPLSLVVGLVVGHLGSAIVLGAITAGGIVAGFARLMQTMKRGRPPGYFMQQLIIVRSKTGFGPPAPFVNENGPLSTRRTRPVAVIGRHVPWPESYDG